ncbi:MAG: extra-cellular endo-beta-1,4-galactanase [Ruminococcaceae bacterium]|nr:extra-cellular endo-beta-1,4-galactanase [Oscillospiraceae bacterium]
MKHARSALIILMVLCMVTVTLTGCKPTPSKPEINTDWKPNATGADVSSDSLFVTKVDNLSDDFIMGMDASCVPALEASGVKYYDYDGQQKDVYEILAQNGINYIRVRVWNDPFDANGNGYGGGNCNIENAVAIGKRATAQGMKLLVNFHYSDFWADPAKQMVPKAWKSMNIDDKAEALYQYTKDCLQKLVDAGVDVGMVQVGNETNGAMCGESSSELGGWKRITQLMSAGARAVREVCPHALVAVHFANPEKATNYESYGKNLQYYGVDYDVFASSYYPFWHGTLDNLANVLNNIATTYGKKVMIAETSYAFTADDTDFSGNTIGEGGGIVKDYPFTLQGQANLVRDVIDTAANQIKDCIGVFYWEGTWISVGGESYEQNLALWEKHGSGWASSYAAEYDPDDAGKWYGGCAVDNQAFFDADGKALESLKVFSLVRKGNTVDNRADAIEDVNLIIDLNGDIVLPDKVNAIMLDNSKQQLDVQWTNVDIDAMKNGGVAKYTIEGMAGGMRALCYVSMVEYNFLTNWSFEEGKTGWTATAIGSFNELMVEDKVTDSMTGTKHYHFWGATANTVEFTLEQQVNDLKSGKYNYAISIMGGDGGATEIYAYVKINGEIVHRADTQITVYNEWHTATINGIEYNEGDTIVVGIYVKCAGPNAWGKIDDALLNSVKE